MARFTPELERRYDLTVAFMRTTLPPPARILDLGTPNPLSERLVREGYTVFNTCGDLDTEPSIPLSAAPDAVCAFEILEHLFSPFPLLRDLKSPRLFTTVPLRLWFQSAYRNPSDPWDCHFHEFEDWQFDRLIEKAGWQILRREKWTAPIHRPGFRPLLRRFIPRYYAVEAVRSQDRVSIDIS